jgi:hypothetical protein
MTDNQPSIFSARGRRNTQRYRRGAYTSFLNSNAQIALTHHLARKNRTTHSTPADPINDMLGKYHCAPLNARRN